MNCVNQNSVERPLVEAASVASSVEVENQQRIIMETIVGQLDFHGQDVEEHVLQEIEEEKGQEWQLQGLKKLVSQVCSFCID